MTQGNGQRQPVVCIRERTLFRNCSAMLLLGEEATTIAKEFSLPQGRQYTITLTLLPNPQIRESLDLEIFSPSFSSAPEPTWPQKL
jgi:hypothetical protein